MNKDLIIGSVLHDLGKFIMRSTNEKTNHSLLGYNYLKEKGITNDKILNSVLYHHKNKITNANLTNDDFSYITYVCDNISSAIDRRKKDYGNIEFGYDKKAPLMNIFNLLNTNKNNIKSAFNVSDIDIKKDILLPKDIEKARNLTDKYDYSKAFEYFDKNFEYITNNDINVNSLLQLIESTFSFIPASTDKNGINDVSLYSHSKLTAAIASCFFDYFKFKGITDYKKCCFSEEENIYSEKTMILLSGDLSGIQNFIFNISSKGALRSIKGRSFYLEIEMENIIDEMLNYLDLSRANLLYNGGGHFYMLLANTKETKDKIKYLQNKINSYFLRKYYIDLYIAFGYSECSANELININNNDTLSKIYKKAGHEILKDKINRYKDTLDELFNDNSKYINNDLDLRECSVCKRSYKDLHENEDLGSMVCESCESMYKLGEGIFRVDTMKDEMLFSISSKKEKDFLISLFSLDGENYLYLKNKNEFINDINNNQIIRGYSINNPMIGVKYCVNIWMGNYTRFKGKSLYSFSDLSKRSIGINRLGVLRMDVDDLGSAFIKGFDKEGEDKYKYATISRFQSLSSMLSMFFKFYLNKIAGYKDTKLYFTNKDFLKNISIIYAGGDDLFIVGAWNEVLDLSINIRQYFKIFSNDRLSISAGLGMYDANLPINNMASLSANLLEISKENTKDSITLFDENNVYKWDEFINDIYGNLYLKFNEYCFFDEEEKCEDKIYLGNGFLYKLLNLLKNSKESINLARISYALAMIEPKNLAQRENYNNFTNLIIDNINSKENIKKLITTIILIIYLNREREE